MGLFGLFYFVFKCIKLTSCLAYICSRLSFMCFGSGNIETNSNDHMRKMVTYWILFSLICLFEHTFGGLIQWLPVWPNAKILVIFWLVIPRFNGARIAYNILVRPCLSGQLRQVVLDLLNKNQYLSLEGEPFLVVAQRYINKHGTEDLEELISIKPKTVKPAFSQDAIKAVEILNGSEAVAEDKPKNIEPTFSQDDSKAVEILNESGAPAVNKITTKLNAYAKVKDMTLPSPLEENVQREWTCAVCQVTTNSETTLNLHLQERKHRTKCEELKAEKQWKLQQKNIEPTFSEDDSKAVEILNESGAPAVNKPKVIEPKSSHDDIKTVEILTGSAAAADNKTTTKPNACVDVKILTLPAPLEEDVQREWTCAVCQVTTMSEATLKLHLQGRKNRTKCEELKAGKQTTKKGVIIGGPNRERCCTICQVKSQSEAAWNSHVQGKKHKSKCKEFNARVLVANKKKKL